MTNISVTPGGVLPVIHISQYDTGRSVDLQTDAVIYYDTAEIHGTRPDGAGVTQQIATNGRLTSFSWKPSADFTDIAGDVRCELVFLHTQYGRVGTANFILRVEKAGKEDGAPEAWSSIRITQGGTFNVKPYAEAVIDILTPSGQKQITSNGVFDISAYESVSVNVPGIHPTGTKYINSNGTHDVEAFKNAVVSVPGGGGMAELAAFMDASETHSGTLDLTAYPITTLADNVFRSDVHNYSEIKLTVENVGEMSYLSNLQSLTLSGAQEIAANAFRYDYSLTELHLTDISSLPVLGNSGVFGGTPIDNGTGTIYLPTQELVDEAQTATNWSAYASQIAVEP